MFEHKTYEQLMKDKLEEVERIFAGLDRRKGSVIYTALAPESLEEAMLYIALDTVLRETFAASASREYLVKRCADRLITPYPATCSIGVAEFKDKNGEPFDVAIGTEFSCDIYNWVVTKKNKDGEHEVTCVTAGDEPNHVIGKLIPISNVKGLASAELVRIAVYGEDEEETEKLRARYLRSFNNKAYGFNRIQYIQVISELQGVGSVKPFRATRVIDGEMVSSSPGYVTIVLTDSEYGVPTGELIDKVQTVIDPTQNSGEGIGLAPIDHEVAILPVKERRIDISSDITFKQGYTIDDCKSYIEATVDEYFKSLNEKWGDVDSIIVRISQIESRLLNLTDYILDIASTKLNGVEENLTIEPIEIAVRGEIVDEEKVEDDEEEVVPITEIVYYVNKDSEEETEDGTQNYPFKSIQVAIDSIPETVIDATINISPAQYDEDVQIKGQQKITIVGLGEKVFIRGDKVVK